MMKKIYYGKAVYDNKEINAVINVLKHDSLSLIDGRKVKKLEKLVSKSFGKKYGDLIGKHLFRLELRFFKRPINIGLFLFFYAKA